VPQRIKLDVDHPSLGAIRLDLRSRGADVAAAVTTERTATGQALSSMAAPLQDSLAHQGVNLTDFSVLTQGQQQRGHEQPAAAQPLGRSHHPNVTTPATAPAPPGRERIDLLI
jgi:flagellar hook-length control protein FliK